MDGRQRLLVSVASLATVEGSDLEAVLNAALTQEIPAVELQEVLQQAAPYIGFAKAEKSLAALAHVLGERGISLPLEPQATVTEADRLEKGIAVQKAIFGPMIDAMRANAAPDQMLMQDALSAHCFGDTYTRGTFDPEETQTGWKNGDINLAGGRFSILFDGEENSHNRRNMMIIAHIDQAHLGLVRQLPADVKFAVAVA